MSSRSHSRGYAAATVAGALRHGRGVGDGALSDRQRETLVSVAGATLRGEWFRARGSGERVTLASLYRYGLLERRAWRGGGMNKAHEYRVIDVVVQELRVVAGDREFAVDLVRDRVGRL